jgi:hypothetical protein
MRLRHPQHLLITVVRDKRLRELFEVELAKKGVQCNMKAFIPYCTGEAGITEERYT